MNFREQIFVVRYLATFNAMQSAIDAGYAESTAHNASAWVSETNCPPHKLHVRAAVRSEIARRFEQEGVDSDWVLRRAKLLADFNIRRFLVPGDDGQMYYDFRRATDDDWYCIDEYTVETLGADRYRADKVKVKAVSKLAAIKLVGDHVKVQAFREQVEHSGTVTQVTMTPDAYRAARAAMLKEDDC